MSSVANAVLRFFRGRSLSQDPLAVPSATERFTRRSSGFGEFMRRISDTSGLSILDVGSTSPANISFLTNLGHKVYNEDVLLGSIDPEFSRKGEDGKPVVDVSAFLKHSLVYEPEQFDAVLCWDVPDYLNEAVVKPVIERIHRIMRPGGVMLAFFHTRDAGPDASQCLFGALFGAHGLACEPGEKGLDVGPFQAIRVETRLEQVDSTFPSAVWIAESL